MILNKLLSVSDEVTRIVHESISKNRPLLLTYFNQHCFNVYYENTDYKNLIDINFKAYKADLGVYLASKFLNHSATRRIESTNMNETILAMIINRKIPVAIIGGSFPQSFVTNEAKKKGIILVKYVNGFFADSETDKIISELRKTDAQVLFIGMGVPKQELFAKAIADALIDRTIICVGLFFEYYFGTTKRAPKFMQKIGFEWMFRLFSEPKRLWKRYLIGIPKFFYRVIKIKLGLKVI